MFAKVPLDVERPSDIDRTTGKPMVREQDYAYVLQAQPYQGIQASSRIISTSWSLQCQKRFTKQQIFDTQSEN